MIITILVGKFTFPATAASKVEYVCIITTVSSMRNVYFIWPLGQVDPLKPLEAKATSPLQSQTGIASWGTQN